MKDSLKIFLILFKRCLETISRGKFFLANNFILGLTKLFSITVGLLFFVFVLMFSKTNTVFAQYQGAQLPSNLVSITKTVFNPQTNQFVKNLSADQFLFLPNQEIIFRIEVKNLSNEELDSLQITDKIPDLLIFLLGPGNLDKGGNTLNFTVDSLKPNESKTFELRMKIKSEQDLPANTVCPSNLAQVTVMKMMDQDTSSFCVQKKVLGVTQELPRTGPSDSLLILFVSFVSLTLSFYLFRKSLAAR